MDGNTKRQRKDDSVAIGYLGSAGSFTCVAAESFFGKIAGSSAGVYASAQSHKEIFDGLQEGSLAYGVIPVESSTTGSLIQSYDSLLKYSPDVTIVGETIERDLHCLCAMGNVEEVAITRVISHPVIVQDCSVYLDALDARRSKNGHTAVDRVTARDSAAACQDLVSSADNSQTAVICTKQAAALYGLKIVCYNISSDRNAETRYAIVSKGDPLRVGQSINAIGQVGRTKASIAVSVNNSPGSMFRMVSCFGLRDLNIIKLESRPSSTAMGMAHLAATEFRHWDTIFFIDYEPSATEAINEALLANLSEFCVWTRPLGKYRQCGQPNTVTVLSDWGSMVDILATA
jgi:chorismate mutase / prephenate dehydratase